MGSQPPSATGRIGLVAGEGDLPRHLAEAGRRNGVDLLVIGIEGLVDAQVRPEHVLGLGEVGRLKRLLDSHGVERVAFAGRFYRPDFSSVSWDAGAVKLLPKILLSGVGGDDNASRVIGSIVESWGMGVAGPLEIAPEFAAGACALSRRKATRAQARDIEAGLAVISTLAPHDVGQAVIVHDGRVLAVEAAEGTDAMIGRISALRAAGRLRAKAPSGVLVKAAKPGQEMRMDMPVIGAQTVRMCAENGLAGIAVARAEVLVATPGEVRAAADDAGLFVAVAERAEPSA